MTLRRILAQDDRQVLPNKYKILFSSIPKGTATETQEIHSLEIVLSGMSKSKDLILADIKADGDVVDKQSVCLKTETKLNTSKAPSSIVREIKMLVALLPNIGRYGQALILGAFVYFINPLDLIADSIVALGFLDDLGILCLVRKQLLPSQ